jgi:hypothetical protein
MDSIGGAGGGGWGSLAATALNAYGQYSKYKGQRQVASGMDVQADAYDDIGERRAHVAEIQAEQLEEAAGQQLASSQRTAEETRRQGRFAASRALAVAAASGGGASDPTVVKIISDMAGETAYRSMTNLYDGEVAARNSLKQAEAERYGGQIARMDARRAASATRSQADNTRSAARVNALTGIGMSLYDKYGKDIDPRGGSDTGYVNATDSGMFDGEYVNATDFGAYD